MSARIGVALVALVCLTATAQAQTADSVQQARTLAEASRLRLEPKILSYDARSDSFTKQSSVGTTTSKGRPGGDNAYYGTRLNQYRFLGNMEQGGFYEAYQWYLEDLNLDPANYRYRFTR